MRESAGNYLFNLFILYLRNLERQQFVNVLTGKVIKPLSREKYQHFLILYELLIDSLLQRGRSLFHGTVPKTQALLKSSSPVLGACGPRLCSGPSQFMPTIWRCQIV